MKAPNLHETDEVHVWWVSIPVDGLAPDRVVLSPWERTRAARFEHLADRLRYEASHAALRRILALYLDAGAAALSIVADRFGKPRLETKEPLRFNLAHAGRLALVAVAGQREIGVDVEEHQDFDHEAVARSAFSASEIEALMAIDPRERLRAFFRGWTRKEAYSKARGLGLRMDLRSFDVSLGPVARLLCTRPDPGEASRWSLHDLAAPPRHSAALALEGRGARVTSFRWEEP